MTENTNECRISIPVRLSPAWIESLNNIARSQLTTRSQIIRLAVHDYLNRAEAQAAVGSAVPQTKAGSR